MARGVLKDPSFRHVSRNYQGHGADKLKRDTFEQFNTQVKNIDKCGKRSRGRRNKDKTQVT